MQAFSALILAEKEFVYPLLAGAPHDDLENVCVTVAGAGCVNTCDCVPSLTEKEYIVLAGFAANPEIGKVITSSVHNLSVPPGLPKLTAGLEPTNT